MLALPMILTCLISNYDVVIPFCAKHKWAEVGFYLLAGFSTGLLF